MIPAPGKGRERHRRAVRKKGQNRRRLLLWSGMRTAQKWIPSNPLWRCSWNTGALACPLTRKFSGYRQRLTGTRWVSLWSRSAG